MSTYEGGKLLPKGYRIQNYRITGVLGEGGFGITYLAEDEVLHSQVAIKEYFPTSLATRGQTNSQISVGKGDSERYFAWGLDRFISEARILAKIDHPNIVRVLNFARLNGTGYMVMPYEKGTPLDAWVRRFDGDRLPPDTVMALIGPITEALAVVHGMGLIHRDVKPANIIVRENGSPVLIDFGAARDTVSAASKTMAAIVSTGYSPIEQYSDLGKQGPWTDIYALAAVAHQLITGKTPPDAPSRISATAAGQPDTCAKLAELRPGGYPAGFLAAVDQGLQVRPELRPQSISEWRGMLGFDSDGLERTILLARGQGETTRGVAGRGAGGARVMPRAALAGFAGAALALAAAGAGYMMWKGEPPGEPLQIAEEKPAPSKPAAPTPIVSPAPEASDQTAPPEPAPAPAPRVEQERPAEREQPASVNGTRPDPAEKTALLAETPAATAPATTPPVETPPQPLEKTPHELLEQRLASSLLWVTLRQEFPDWYRTRLRDTPEAIASTATSSRMTGLSIAQLKSLRIANAEDALLAPAEFKQIAAVYIWNLEVLRQTSDEACRDGIGKGEGSQYLHLVLDHPSAPYETLIALILRASVAGRAEPVKVGKPRASDYQKLVKRLRALGWSQSDLEIMSDPNKLGRAPAEKVCRLVSEYYKAHLALDDEKAQLRLLKESLRPMIAG